jgi:hypothetical protein
MALLDTVKGFFSRKEKLADLDADELRKARAQLEYEQARILRQIDDIEKQKAKLDTDGRAERQARKQRILAQQMLDLESQAKHHDRTLAVLAKQQRVVNGFIFLKENARVLANTPLGDIISRMDTAELQAYVDSATIDGSLQLEKLEQLLGVLDEGEAGVKTSEEDADVAGIVARWQQEQESEASVPDLEPSTGEAEAPEDEN